MITNLGFDFSAYGGSNPEYFASTAAAEARLRYLEQCAEKSKNSKKTPTKT